MLEYSTYLPYSLTYFGQLTAAIFQVAAKKVEYKEILLFAYSAYSSGYILAVCYFVICNPLLWTAIIVT